MSTTEGVACTGEVEIVGSFLSFNGRFVPASDVLSVDVTLAGTVVAKFAWEAMGDIAGEVLDEPATATLGISEESVPDVSRTREPATQLADKTVQATATTVADRSALRGELKPNSS